MGTMVADDLRVDLGLTVPESVPVRTNKFCKCFYLGNSRLEYTNEFIMLQRDI